MQLTAPTHRHLGATMAVPFDEPKLLLLATSRPPAIRNRLPLCPQERTLDLGVAPLLARHDAASWSVDAAMKRGELDPLKAGT